jgi:hypothetical protein
MGFGALIIERLANRRNTANWDRKLCHFVTLRHSLMCHCVERRTSDKGLGCLRLNHPGRKLTTKDGFHAKHGSFCQGTGS